jgi:hypothetical protein
VLKYNIIITSNLFLGMVENYALWQLKNNLIFQLDGAHVCFAHIVHDRFNFPGWFMGRGGPIVWGPCSPDLTPLDIFLWGYMKDQAYSQRECVERTQSTDQCSNCRCYKGHVNSMSGNRWTVVGLYGELQLFHLCKKKNKILQTTPLLLFSFLSYRYLKSQHSLW